MLEKMQRSTVTVGQVRDLLNREARGEFGEEGLGADLQWFADNQRIVRGLRNGTIKFAKPPLNFSTAYNQALGLARLLRRAVGKLGTIHPDITQKRFPFKGTDVRQVNLRVEPFLSGETGEEAAKRLTAAGHMLANIGDLAGFFHDHPEEVENWTWVVVLSEDSRWTSPNGDVFVPYAEVCEVKCFNLDEFLRDFQSDDGVLVLCE